MKRKADEIFNQLDIGKFPSARWSAEAQKALMDDLLAALPEKHTCNDKCKANSDRWLEAHRHAMNGWNNAIYQMEQAIRSYFGQTKGKGE